MLVKLQITDPVINKKRYYTIAALKDELIKQLSSMLETSGNTENNDENTVYKYHIYAKKLLYRINLAKPVPIFEISIRLLDLIGQAEMDNEIRKTVKKLLKTKIL